MFLKKIAAIAALFCCVGVAYAQSPWARSKAGFFVQAGFQTIPTYSVVYNADGAKSALERTINENQLQFYGEYGWTKKSTLVLDLPLRFVQTGERTIYYLYPTLEKGRKLGVGNASVALKHQFYAKKIQMAAQLKLELPTGKVNAETGLSTGFPAWTIAPSLSIGRRYRKFYLFGYSGVGWRSHQFSSFSKTGFEIGQRWNRFWLIGRAEALISFKNGHFTPSESNKLTYLYIDNQEYISYTVKSLFQKNRFWGFNLYLSGPIVTKNLPYQVVMGMGVSFKWD